MSERQEAMIQFLSIMISGVSVFIAIVLGFLIVYASRYLIRRRKKEFGIYLTLGMPTAKVSRVIVYETLFVGLLSLVVGLLAGIIVSEILLYATAALFDTKMDTFVFMISWPAVIQTVVYFAVIFFVALIFNVFSVSRYKLIDLINADKKNEGFKLRSLPLSVFLFIVSLILIGIAYWLLIDNGMTQFDEQFAASTALVCVGTFLLFFSLSGFLLRAVQANKKLYFKGLSMFTLRQLSAKINTAFASISLVCMALFLAITSTCGGFALCTTFNTSIDKTTQYDASFCVYYGGTAGNELWGTYAAEDDYSMKNAFERDVPGWNDLVEKSSQTSFYYSDVPLGHIIDNTEYEVNKSLEIERMRDTELTMVSASEFNAQRALLDLEPIELTSDEYLIWCDFETVAGMYDEYVREGNTIETFGHTLNPAIDHVDTTLSETAQFTMNTGALVVADEIIPEDIDTFYTLLNAMFVGDRESTEEPLREALREAYPDEMEYSENTTGWPFSRLITATEMIDQSVGLSVIIAYLAIYIGFVLLIACAAILALKQLSEAADNVTRYDLLQKIGTDDKMINKALFAQIGIYFIFPLIVALCHSFVALIVVVDMVMIYGFIDITIPLLATIAAFLLIYGGYYLITYFASRSMVRA